MADSILIADLAFYRRDDVPDDIAWWASAEPDHPISIVIEPSGPIDEETQRRVAEVIRTMTQTLANARAWLAAELRDPGWELDAAELAELDSESFEDPEVIVWNGDEWMVRFGSSVIAMAEPFGIGVLFDGDEPVAVEDLSDADEDDDA